ncbi:hypothetical protein EV668_4465 [Enterovirga rhinocerotis]|uniref:Secreted protein n=1 Tax=Enterovirga rhinocerotis TaxID=1339210 RepID=A0A4R7BJ40_9HYPH|nr:hypothetical protein EV668_4465 [Enterovirga rhinocerotis]
MSFRACAHLSVARLVRTAFATVSAFPATGSSEVRAEAVRTDGAGPLVAPTGMAGASLSDLPQGSVAAAMFRTFPERAGSPVAVQGAAR